jgi:hypothetical protein
MFVAHFGNGDEADQDLVLKYAREVSDSTVKEITIIPGTNYGHLVLESHENVMKLMKSLQERNATAFEKRTLVFFPTLLDK